MGDQLERSYGLNFDARDSSFNFAGRQYYGVPTELPTRTERVDASFASLARQAHGGNGAVFALERVRTAVFSEARFQFRQMKNGRPGDLFGTADLTLLETPWVNGTTGDLLSRMLLDADLAGNAYVASRPSGLVPMRPDWVSIVIGVPGDEKSGPNDIDAEVLGYVYWPGGFAIGQERKPVYLSPSEVAHFAPNVDPQYRYKGRSWLSAVLEEIDADVAATVHKAQFFRNGATLQNVVTFDKEMRQEQVKSFAEMMNAQHQGTANAYKTLYLGGGADVKTIGMDFRQLDFKATQGAGETRLAAAAGVPPIIVGFSEGLSAATYSNYGQAKRHYADATLRPLWRNVAASLAPLVTVPGGADLWYDDRDIPFLREDMKDAAEVQQIKSATIRSYIDGGFTADSAVKAVESDDPGLLVHTGLFSVQLQAPGSTKMPGGEVAGELPVGDGTTPAVPKLLPVPLQNGKVPVTTGGPA